MFNYYSELKDRENIIKYHTLISRIDECTLKELYVLTDYYLGSDLIKIYDNIHSRGGDLSADQYFFMATQNKYPNLQYLKCAADKNHPRACFMYAMSNVGLTDKHFYISKAISLGYSPAMVEYGNLELSKNNSVEMEKYYLMAMDNNNFDGWENLKKYYIGNKNYRSLLIMHLKYIKSGKILKHGLINVINEYLTYTENVDNEIINLIINTDFDDVSVPLFVKIIKDMAAKELNLAQLHFENEPGSSSYMNASERFTYLKTHYMDAVPDKNQV